MMNAGGFRVSPLEVEAVLAHLPGLTDVRGGRGAGQRRAPRVIACFYVSDGPLAEAGAGTPMPLSIWRATKQPRALVRVDASAARGRTTS